ncbi:transposase [Natronorubrum sp. JWXQ-INN-674]|uniref:Transposase n=1 Tax=Natronorubrum halalkaliphilum TaxID=2691917 RepID=A0A6B0VNA6_9EURY|nr:transposase [Natronorubrum halalkaliphilum]MXV62948.1 transposase [Natronorubrum halalkaliphilum]
MRRSNTFEVRPRSEEDEQLLRRLLDASASLWNETTYARRERFFGDDGNVWDADTGTLEGQYKDVVGSATAQQIIRKNTEAWRSFFKCLEDPDQDARPPGYWGNEDDGRELRTYIRGDQYTLKWGERSRLEIPVGTKLKDEFGLGYRERLRLEVSGEPKWSGEHGRLEIVYDEVDGTFRAFQPVTIDDSRLDTPLASSDEAAALDIGANNLIACTTTTGQQYLYEGRDLFAEFREATEKIAHYQSKLDDQRRTSKRIDRLYRKRTRQRNHAQDALVRDLVEQLADEGISTVYVGDLADVLSTHWSCRVNEKTHNFWAYRRFIGRLESVCEEYGIDVAETSEAWTSQECPDCGSRDKTIRHEDTLTCSCGFEGHADLTASRTFLERQVRREVRPMARPVRLKWTKHEWREHHSSLPNRGTTANEERTNQSTCTGKVASVETQTD